MENLVDEKDHGRGEQQVGGLVDVRAFGAELIPAGPLGLTGAGSEEDERESCHKDLDDTTPHGGCLTGSIVGMLEEIVNESCGLGKNKSTTKTPRTPRNTKKN